MKKILYLLLHTQKHANRYDNCINTWLQGQDYLFYSDHEDLEKNILKVTDRNDYESNEEKFVNVVKTLPEEYFNYEWYFFVDSDTFVNTKKLVSILDTLDTNKFYGQKLCHWPGDEDMDFLSGGAGKLVSHVNFMEMREKIEIKGTGLADVCMGIYMKENNKIMEHSPLFKSQPPHHYKLESKDSKDYISFHHIKNFEEMKSLYMNCINI